MTHIESEKRKNALEIRAGIRRERREGRKEDTKRSERAYRRCKEHRKDSEKVKDTGRL